MTQGEINAPYYDGCGVFDDDSSNDCIQDCFGSWGGTAVIDECGNCGGNGPEKNKNCQGDCLVDTDCFGICGGKAKLDDCGKCDEDYFNDCLKEYFDKCGIFDADPLNDCVEDCTGIWGGKVKFDSCGICGGDNSTCADCAGTPYGTAKYDNCNICDDNPFNDCSKDCEGKWGGLVEIDGCGICGGDNSTCADCAGVPYGNSVLDNCNICDDNIENDCIQDCSGIWGGYLEIDDCGICGGALEVNEYCNCNMDTFDCLGVCGGTAKDNDCTSLNDNETSLSADVDLRKSIKLDKSIYFNRTISYYDFFPEISNPFYDEIENLSLVSNYIPRKYHALNRTKELKKLKKHTVMGSDGKTFITSYKYGEQNILIPSVTTVDYYKSTKIKNNSRKQSRNFTINHFKKLKNNNSKSKMLSLINKDFGFTNIAINLSGQIEIKGELEFTDTQGSTLSSNNNESWNLDINQKQQFDL